MELKKNAKNAKNAKIFYCEKCDFTCNKKSEWDRHILTRKHNKELNGIKKTPKKKYICEVCKKQYLSQSGLWKHQNQNRCLLDDNKIIQEQEDEEEEEEKQLEEQYEEQHEEENIKMHTENNNSNSDNSDLKYKDMFMAMVDENKKLRTEIFSEIKGMMVEIIPKIQSNNTTNNTNIININMFLNEQCKDAMNISDFIESIQLTIEDMVKIGQEGQTNGMSNILINKLNELDVFKRPVHCSDITNETIYVKDKDKWEEDDLNKPILKDALDKFTKKSIQAMPCMKNKPDEYIKAVSEVLKDPREDDKIISKLAKNIVV